LKKSIQAKKMLKLKFFIDDKVGVGKLKASVNNKQQLMHLRRQQWLRRKKLRKK
jgi:hypothetical protein